MKKRKRVWVLSLILATPVILLLAVWLYVGQLSQATESSVIAFMEELSEHDMQNIQSELRSSWDEITAVYTRTQASRCHSIQEVCGRLNIEQVTNSFDIIYLVDSEGNTYSGVNAVQNGSDKLYIQPMLAGNEKYVMRFDDEDILEASRENLVYGVRCDPFLVDNIQFVGIVGFSKINMIEDRLKIDSFDGRGYTGIIDTAGNYIVNRDRSAGIGKTDNYFDQFREHADLSKQEIGQISARLERGESFTKHLKNSEDGKQVVSFIPIPETTWNIVLTVPEKVFSEQTKQFVAMTGVMLAVVVFALCVMMLLIARALLASTAAKAEAKARGDFLSSMSHEIRTPLNGIVGLNYLMQQNIKNPKKLEECLEKSVSTTEYLLSLVNDILDMSKLQAGKMELMPQPFSVHDLIATLESIIHNRMDEKNIRFKVEEDSKLAAINGDEMRIKQILINILGNAAKFTPKDGCVTLRISQSLIQTGIVRTRFEVEDNGCGMTEEFQEKIFNSFSQEHNTVSPGTQGTGLGMSISSLLAKQMGGTLSVTSKLGEGSCFVFTVTTEIADTHDRLEKIAISDGGTGKHSKDKRQENLKILVAEDNTLNAEILVELLTEAGFATVHAADGGQVVEIFKASSIHEFDIILMDVQMPIRNGYEATKLIRTLKRPDAATVIIYACTASTFKEDQDRARECGMNGFIAKPIDVEKLMQELDKLA